MADKEEVKQEAKQEVKQAAKAETSEELATEDKKSADEEESESESEEDNQPSDAKLAAAITKILDGGDLSSLTSKKVRKMLEDKFGCKLKEKKKFINSKIKELVEANQNQNSSSEEEEAPKKRKISGGLAAPVTLSKELSELLGGKTELNRTQVIKELWVYIKENELQDPDHKKNIINDEKMKKVFEVETMSMFEMNKLLSRHLTKIPGAKAVQSDDTEEKPKKKRKAGGNTGGLSKEFDLSEALQAVVQVKRAARTQVVKLIWVYIKENNLQNPKDKREILCDDKLKAVMGKKKVTMFSMNKFIGPHLHDE